ncbi:MAG: RHS repeat-associated core domain-containing protein [Acidimicrobiales bacterium]
MQLSSGADQYQLVNYTDYDVYGDPITASDGAPEAGGVSVPQTGLKSSYVASTPWGYGGGYTDATGLVYMVHRYYDPVTGQFISVDPMVRETASPYGYAEGDPVRFSDPYGLGVMRMVESVQPQGTSTCFFEADAPYSRVLDDHKFLQGEAEFTTCDDDGDFPDVCQITADLYRSQESEKGITILVPWADGGTESGCPPERNIPSIATGECTIKRHRIWSEFVTMAIAVVYWEYGVPPVSTSSIDSPPSEINC